MTAQSDLSPDRAPFRGVVALDGPSGTGKSTVARGLATRLDVRYLDTGAMYRAATLAVLRASVATDDPVLVADVMEKTRIEISTDPSAPSVALHDEPVDVQIRSAEVTAAVSAVSALPAVRAILVAAQRELIEGGPIVVEGRDIASVVWPTARLKVYLDTGAMYRAATLAVLRAAVATDDPVRAADVVEKTRIEISTDPSAPSVALDDEPVDIQIRSAEVTAAVSAVSALPAVRAILVAAQRELIDGGPIVVEGRDIASVVWPTARLKVYLTASPEVRARRRAGELGDHVDVAEVAADIERRDRLDSTRAASPLAKSDHAVELDTTDLDVAEVIDRLVDLAMKSNG